MSPMLFETLRAVGRARAAGDVHLLSNGMLLKPNTVRRLVDHGVTSLAVSLDGATPPPTTPSACWAAWTPSSSSCAR